MDVSEFVENWPALNLPADLFTLLLNGRKCSEILRGLFTQYNGGELDEEWRMQFGGDELPPKWMTSTRLKHFRVAQKLSRCRWKVKLFCAACEGSQSRSNGIQQDIWMLVNGKARRL